MSHGLLRQWTSLSYFESIYYKKWYIFLVHNFNFFNCNHLWILLSFAFPKLSKPVVPSLHGKSSRLFSSGVCTRSNDVFCIEKPKRIFWAHRHTTENTFVFFLHSLQIAYFSPDCSWWKITVVCPDYCPPVGLRLFTSRSFY